MNLTLRELAAKVKVDFTYLSKIENDKTDYPPSEDLLRRLAKELKDDPEELMLLSGQVPEHNRKDLTGKGEHAVRFFRSAREYGLTWEELHALVEKHGKKTKK